MSIRAVFVFCAAGIALAGSLALATYVDRGWAAARPARSPHVRGSHTRVTRATQLSTADTVTETRSTSWWGLRATSVRWLRRRARRIAPMSVERPEPIELGRGGCFAV